MHIQHFLERSAAAEPFRAAVARFLRDGQPNEHIRFSRSCPVIKVERTLTKVLESHAALPIETVELDASSGCEFFRGTALIEAGERTLRVAFDWDCRWKAEQLGWTDYFGFPDQARAAREFGYDCFRQWAEQGRLDAVPR